MNNAPPPIERVTPIRLSRLLSIAALLSALASILYFTLIPKQVSFRTTPLGASIYVNEVLRCTKTPCDIALNRLLPKRVMINMAQHHPHIIELPFLGIGWDEMLREPLQLSSIFTEDDRVKALQACQDERAKLPDQKNIEAKPCFRVAPTMPWQAARSGHCHVIFDIEATGKVASTRLNGCTSRVFEGASLQAVSLWVYLPEIKNGEAVRRKDVESRITFRLADERGSLIPEEPVFAKDPSHSHFISVSTSIQKDED